MYDAKALTATQRKQVVKLIKKADKANSANRRFPYTSNQTLVAGRAYTFNPLAQIAIGSGISNREANMIMVDSIELNVMVTANTAALAPNMRYLMYMFNTDEELLSPSASFYTTNNSGLLSFLPNIGNAAGGYCTSVQLDTTRAKLVGFYKRGVLDGKISTVANEHVMTLKVNMRGRKYKYLSDTTGAYMDGNNLFFAFVADANGATVDVSNVGSLSVTYKVNFH